MSDNDGIADLHPDTLLVHGGTLRSSFGETSEALFLTSGYVYNNAADAEARFKNEVEGYTYSRFANPTNTMFETRMALLEGAEAARSKATGMAAVSSALLGYLKAGDHVVAPHNRSHRFHGADGDHERVVAGSRNRGVTLA